MLEVDVYLHARVLCQCQHGCCHVPWVPEHGKMACRLLCLAWSAPLWGLECDTFEDRAVMFVVLSLSYGMFWCCGGWNVVSLDEDGFVRFVVLSLRDVMAIVCEVDFGRVPMSRSFYGSCGMLC